MKLSPLIKRYKNVQWLHAVSASRWVTGGRSTSTWGVGARSWWTATSTRWWEETPEHHLCDLYSCAIWQLTPLCVRICCMWSPLTDRPREQETWSMPSYSIGASSSEENTPRYTHAQKSIAATSLSRDGIMSVSCLNLSDSVLSWQMKALGVVPMCSYQYERMFNTTRTPGIETGNDLCSRSAWKPILHLGTILNLRPDLVFNHGEVFF